MSHTKHARLKRSHCLFHSSSCQRIARGPDGPLRIDQFISPPRITRLPSAVEHLELELNHATDLEGLNFVIRNRPLQTLVLRGSDRGTLSELEHQGDFGTVDLTDPSASFVLRDRSSVGISAFPRRRVFSTAYLRL